MLQLCNFKIHGWQGMGQAHAPFFRLLDFLLVHYPKLTINTLLNNSVSINKINTLESTLMEFLDFFFVRGESGGLEIICFSAFPHPLLFFSYLHFNN